MVVMAQLPRTIALTGATGFVGRTILLRLLAQGCQVRLLLPHPTKLALHHHNILPVKGNLFCDRALANLTDGADAIIHLVGIIREHRASGQTFEQVHHEGTRCLLDAAEAAGVRRWIHMSALGARAEATCRYHKTKWRAEQVLRQSGMAWTIFQPSLIHGPQGELMQMIRSFWQDRMPPIVPYFGSGLLSLGARARVQPIWVEDVADGFVQALHVEKTIGKTYAMVGPTAMTWPEMYATCQRHIPGARRKPICPIPAWLALRIAGLADAVAPSALPFNRDQVVMSQEDSTADPTQLTRDLGIAPREFEDALGEYAGQIR
jgi:uncharacterized protein YbjT (DUF2867 family)